MLIRVFLAAQVCALLGCQQLPQEAGDAAHVDVSSDRLLVDAPLRNKRIAVGGGLAIRESPSVEYVGGQDGGIVSFRVRQEGRGADSEWEEVWATSGESQREFSVALAESDISRAISIPGCAYRIRELPAYAGPYGEDALLWLIENDDVGWLWVWTRKGDRIRSGSGHEQSEDAAALLAAFALCLTDSQGLPDDSIH